MDMKLALKKLAQLKKKRDHSMLQRFLGRFERHFTPRRIVAVALKIAVGLHFLLNYCVMRVKMLLQGKLCCNLISED